MKKVLMAASLLATTLFNYAQQKTPPRPALPDTDQLLKLSPEEQKKFAAQLQKQLSNQAAELSEATNKKTDISSLPGYTIEIPVKDLKKLSVIPASPLSRSQLLEQTARLEAGLRKISAPALLKEVDNIIANGKGVSPSVAGAWYNDQPEAALLLSMKAVQTQPAHLSHWNNLAALYNMCRLEQFAVPLLQHCLSEKPGSSIILNNLGQAYLGMGELTKAKQYLSECLRIDPLHPEANRSMGMISLHAKENDKALEYFEKEMQVSQRRSSLAALKRKGERGRINLARLRKLKMQMDGVPAKDFFSDINLAKFSLPDLPVNSDETGAWIKKHEGFLQSLQQELMFWSNAAIGTNTKQEESGSRYPGLYSDLVNELLSDLGSDYSPILGLLHESDASQLETIINAYYKKLSEISCPQPPLDPANQAALNKAYQQKCCAMKKPVTDAYIAEHNALIAARCRVVESRWKEYINGMISIVQLDPSVENEKMVYATVAEYFTFLINTVNAVCLISGPMECDTKMSAAEADAIIASKRNIELNCPSWLKANFSLYVAKVKADCNAFIIEADVYKMIKVGAEKKFKTGTSTLYVGAGVDGKFYKDILSAQVNQQFYIVFDNNNQFADLGMRGGGSFDIASGMFGEGFTYDFSMSSGFTSNITTKSTWITNLEKAVGYLPK